MAKYRFKNGKLPNSLTKASVDTAEEKAPLLEEEEDTENTKSWSVEETPKKDDNCETREFFNPFDDDEDDDKKTSRNKLKAILGSGKKARETDESVLDKVDKIYSGGARDVEEVDSTMKTNAALNLAEVFGDKKKKKISPEDADGENDTYDIEDSPIEEHENKFSDAEIYGFDDADSDDMYEDEFTKKKKAKNELREFIDPCEKEEFYENYRRGSRKALVAVFSTFVITLLLFYLESPTLLHPSWLTPGKFGILYLLVDLQLLLLAGLCIFNRLYRGAAALFKWAPTKNSISFILFAAAFLQVILHLFVDRYNENIALFSSIAALAALINALAHFLDIRREGVSFRMAATDTPKYIADSLDEESEEYQRFNEYLPESPYMYSISRTSFVSNFVSTAKAPSPFNEIYKIIIPLVLFISIIFAVVSNIMAGTPTFGRTLDNFALALMFSTPIASFFTVSLPFFSGVLKLSRRGCTVIGETSLDACSSTSVLSFKDTDVFHEKGIKVTSVKTYGQTRIDTAILTAARVFNITGGPLKAVFNRSILDAGSSGSSENDEVMQILNNSILSIIDGKKVLVGNREAMLGQGHECPEDGVDEMFINSGGRIMYMTIDEEIAAKFYIKYALGKNFKAILDSFYNIGICMAIKSCDPNLDTDFITKLLRDENYPIIVVKLENMDTTTLEKVSDKKPSGILSNTSIPNMLRSFLWCDKCRRIISLNHLAKYVSILLSVIFLAACLFNADAHEKITPVVVFIYQLIWMIPTFGTSLFQ